MRKRLLVLVGILTVFLMLALSSCGFSSDSLEIESVGAEVLSDGSTRITIKYLDDMEDPVIFDIPAGLTGEQGIQGVPGEKGDVGNGIKEIVINNEVAGQQTLQIVYTDEKMEPTEVVVKDGKQIVSAVREDQEGVPYMRITYSDETSELVELPQGVPGVGIESVSYIPNEETGETMVYFTREDGTSIGPIRIPQGPQGNDGVGITGMSEPEVQYDEFGTPVAVKFHFVLSDGGVTADLTIPYGVGVSNIVSSPLKEGDYVIGTKFQFVKTDGSVTNSIDVLNGVGVDDMTYEVNEDGTTTVTVLLSNGTTRTFDIPAAISIARVEVGTNSSGDTELTIYMTDENIDPVKVSIPKPNGIDSIVTTETDTEYILTIAYTSGERQSVRFAKPTAWHSEYGSPRETDGAIGDYWFDEQDCAIWHKSAAGWEELIDFNDFQTIVDVVFHLSEGESWSVQSNRVTFKMKVGESVASSDEYSPAAIPIPHKEGYVFGGWYTTPSPNPVVHGMFTDLTVISGDLDLYAYWISVSDPAA